METSEITIYKIYTEVVFLRSFVQAPFRVGEQILQFGIGGLVVGVIIIFYTDNVENTLISNQPGNFEVKSQIMKHNHNTAVFRASVITLASVFGGAIFGTWKQASKLWNLCPVT